MNLVRWVGAKPCRPNGCSHKDWITVDSSFAVKGLVEVTACFFLSVYSPCRIMNLRHSLVFLDICVLNLEMEQSLVLLPVLLFFLEALFVL